MPTGLAAPPFCLRIRRVVRDRGFGDCPVAPTLFFFLDLAFLGLALVAPDTQGANALPLPPRAEITGAGVVTESVAADFGFFAFVEAPLCTARVPDGVFFVELLLPEASVAPRLVLPATSSGVFDAMAKWASGTTWYVLLS